MRARSGSSRRSRQARWYWSRATPATASRPLRALLLVRFEQGLWAPGAGAVAFFRVSVDEGRTGAGSFLRALTEQLGGFLDESVPAGEDLEAMRYRAADMLGRLVGRGRRPLLIVDGLDEQDDVAPTVAQVLSGLVADDVACIATTRRNPDPTSRRAPGDPLRGARRSRLRPLDVGELAELLRRHGLGASLAPEVHRLTKGNALYVRSLAVELADRGETVLRDLRAYPPADVTAYFDSQFGLLREQVKATSTTWRALVAIAAAAGPISRDDLAVFLHVCPGEVSDALRPAERYLLPGSDLQFVHVELRRRVQRDAGDLGAVRAQFLAWGQETLASGSQLPGYVVRQHAAALATAGRDHDLVELVSPRWASARRAVDFTWRGLAQDVTLAMDAASRLHRAPNIELLRLSYLRARLRSAATNLPGQFFAALGASGQHERAEAIIDTIVEPAMLARALVSLSTTSKDRAPELLGRAEGAAAGIDDPVARAEALVSVVQVWVGRPSCWEGSRRRHRLLAAGDNDQADEVTEGICSQLHTWGAWEQETALVRDTLGRLGPTSGEAAKMVSPARDHRPAPGGLRRGRPVLPAVPRDQ